MNRLLGGTLVLALASLASAAPQTPTTGKNQPVQTVRKHPVKKGKPGADKVSAQAGTAPALTSGDHNKPGKTQKHSGKPVK